VHAIIAQEGRACGAAWTIRLAGRAGEQQRPLGLVLSHWAFELSRGAPTALLSLRALVGLGAFLTSIKDADCDPVVGL